MKCYHCTDHLPKAVNDFSITKYKVPLCIKHQRWFDHMLNDAPKKNTEQQLLLFLRLKYSGANPTINKYDGHKTVDIAIEDIGLHLEIDGFQHHGEKQAYSDLQRTVYDLEIDIPTIRIPNSLVDKKLDQCAEQLIKIIRKRRGVTIEQPTSLG